MAGIYEVGRWFGLSFIEKIILNLPKHILTDCDDAVFMKGLKFAVTDPHSNVDMLCAVESLISKFPQTLGMEFSWKIRSMLEKSKSSRYNMTKKELKASDLYVYPMCEGCLREVQTYRESTYS
jgi:hypothetical protein